MASLPSPRPPNSSGMVRPNTPSSPSLVMISCGMYSFFRCHSCACGSTSASAKRRICVRISDSVSSRPVSPKVVTAGCAAISWAKRALRPSSVPASIEIADLLLEAADLGARHAQRRQPHGLDLAHGDAAGELRQVLAEGGGRDQPLHLGQALLGLQAPGPAQHLAQRLHVGRDPCEPVRGRLRRIETAGCVHRLAHARLGQMQQPLRRGHRLRAALEVELRGRLRLGDCAHARHGPDPFCWPPQCLRGRTRSCAALHNSAATGVRNR